MRRLPTRPPSAWWSPPMTGPPRPSRPRPRLGVAVVAALLALGATGCGDDAAAPSSPTSTTTSSTTTTAAPDTAAASSTTELVGDEAEVRATIDRYWEAWFAATGNPPDPTNAELNAVLSGEARLKIIGRVERWKTEGQYVRTPTPSVFAYSMQLVTVDGSDRAAVTECVVDDTEVVDQATGEVSNAGAAALTVESTLARLEGAWRITTRTTVHRAEGATTCDMP